MDVLDDCGDFIVVVAEESADERRCGVVDGDDAEGVAVKEATIGDIHCDRQANEQLISCDVCDKWFMMKWDTLKHRTLKTRGKPFPKVASVGEIKVRLPKLFFHSLDIFSSFFPLVDSLRIRVLLPHQ